MTKDITNQDKILPLLPIARDYSNTRLTFHATQLILMSNQQLKHIFFQLGF